MRTLSFILARPKRVMPRISPYDPRVIETLSSQSSMHHSASSLHNDLQQLDSTHLIGHEIRQQHDVSAVDAHTVVYHGVLDLVNDGGPRRFDA